MHHRKHFLKSLLLLTVLIMSIVGLSRVKGELEVNRSPDVDKDILEFYRNYSFYTDPGEYQALYNNLPESLPELCKLIKAQIIHPVSDLPHYRDLIPLQRNFEDDQYPTVRAILVGLMTYNSAGLIYERKPEQRLILLCRGNAILFASILKSRGIPVRVRYGFFTSNLFPGYHIYHVICEVWNEKTKQWFLVDPEEQKVDYSREQFEYAGEIWLRYKENKLEPYTYVGLQDWKGPHLILSILCHDLAAVLGHEPVFGDQPPVCQVPKMDVRSFPSDQTEVLNKLAILLQNPDKNFQELKSIYEKYKYLQFE